MDSIVEHYQQMYDKAQTLATLEVDNGEAEPQPRDHKKQQHTRAYDIFRRRDCHLSLMITLFCEVNRSCPQ